jgi:hypothetical protein
VSRAAVARAVELDLGVQHLVPRLD